MPSRNWPVEADEAAEAFHHQWYCPLAYNPHLHRTPGSTDRNSSIVTLRTCIMVSGLLFVFPHHGKDMERSKNPIRRVLWISLISPSRNPKKLPCNCRWPRWRNDTFELVSTGVHRRRGYVGRLMICEVDAIHALIPSYRKMIHGVI